jgi:hypothetical protein
MNIDPGEIIIFGGSLIELNEQLYRQHEMFYCEMADFIFEGLPNFIYDLPNFSKKKIKEQTKTLIKEQGYCGITHAILHKYISKIIPVYGGRAIDENRLGYSYYYTGVPVKIKYQSEKE